MNPLFEILNLGYWDLFEIWFFGAWNLHSFQLAANFREIGQQIN